MRFLRILGLGRVNPRLVRDIARVIARRDGFPRGRNRLVGHLHPVGAHVGDQPVLVERLGEPHRVARGKAQFARGLLLQRRGGERRRRVAGQRLGLDRLDGEAAVLDDLSGRGRAAFVADRQALDFVAIERDQPRREWRAIGLEARHHRPIFLRPEQLDLALAVDDQAQRDRLHPPRRLGAGELAPQDRREREPDQIIERAAGAVGVDQILVECTRLRHRLEHRALCDRVEGNPLNMRRQRLFLAQHFLDVPADCLTLAVGIGGEDQRVGLSGLVGDRLQLLGLVGVGFPVHREAVVGIDRPVPRRKVADMAIAGEHAVPRPEIFFDGLGLGGRFNDDEFQALDSSHTYTRDCRVVAGAVKRLDETRSCRASVERSRDAVSRQPLDSRHLDKLDGCSGRTAGANAN